MSAPPGSDGVAPPRAVRSGRPLRWLLLAAAPASLMLSVTTYLSTDIAAVPLLWTVPLAIYLGTLALAFAPRLVVPPWLVTSLVPLAVLPLVLVLAADAHEPLAIVISTHLVALAVVALACHASLARQRPAPAQLTRFYLWVAAGGALGGILTALVAPLAFTRVAEYPLALVVACLVLDESTPRGTSRPRVLDFVWPAALALATAGLLAVTVRGPSGAGLVIGVATLAAASFARRPIRFGLGVGAVLLAAAVHGETGGRALHSERTFYGRHRVVLDADGRHHLLVHGTTVHGLQSLDPGRRLEPLAYFHRTGPVGQVAALALAGDARPVAVVGLGTGTLACYGRPGQRFTFYELDPVVVRLARDPRYFTFLRDCPPDVEVVPGDARLSLRDAPAGRYHLLVLDAYSSDAPPVHLLTREAVRLYLDKLAPGGILAFNVTNRHLDLGPVLAALARDAGLTALTRNDPTVSPAERRQGKLPSKWLVMAREASTLTPLAADPRWIVASSGPDTPVWTDSYSAVLHVLHWR
jgi:hypothetical protein